MIHSTNRNTFIHNHPYLNYKWIIWDSHIHLYLFVLCLSWLLSRTIFFIRWHHSNFHFIIALIMSLKNISFLLSFHSIVFFFISVRISSNDPHLKYKFFSLKFRAKLLYGFFYVGLIDWLLFLRLFIIFSKQNESI